MKGKEHHPRFVHSPRRQDLHRRSRSLVASLFLCKEKGWKDKYGFETITCSHGLRRSVKNVAIMIFNIPLVLRLSRLAFIFYINIKWIVSHGHI